MKRRVILLCHAFFLPLLLALFLLRWAGAQTTSAAPIDAALQQQLASDPAAMLHFIVHLQPRADLEDLPAGREARRAGVVQKLQETANTSQRDLLRVLDALQDGGDVATYESLWIINGIAVHGNGAALQTLASRPDVHHISADEAQQLLQPLKPLSATLPGITWGLNRIRARHVWEGLGVTGAGVTVAIMDSGVDWQHPALRANYRGSAADGSVSHDGNWFDAVDTSQEAPVDPFGHGTHVAGTAVGRGGIGVAPGATWIAVRAFDGKGVTQLSTLHESFQWLLAPAGEPTLAPDVVNGSWGSASTLLDLHEDIDALHAAGIVTVFAAGNSGPQPESITVPASYTETVAVAASDERDHVTWFSSLGPSPLTRRVKPDLAAPGANVLSALPGAAYAYAHGTSMAAPHVAGTVALLRAANPALARTEVTAILTGTAAPISNTHPNVYSGWGRLDAYAAVTTQVAAGRLQGTVYRDGIPLAGAAVTITTSSGATLPYTTDANGHYRAFLKAGSYTVATGAFGAYPTSAGPLSVTVDQVTTQDLSLRGLPHGTISGLVVAGDQRPLTATVQLLGTPLTTTADARGHYTLSVPAGTHTVRVRHTGYRIREATLTVAAGANTLYNLTLSPSYSILLVDSGPWYYASQLDYFRQALDALGYAYDEWPVYAPFNETPAATDLLRYDVVVWSAPNDAPGRAQGGDALSAYLENGGNLIVSGQNVGRLDGTGFGTQLWWHDQLQARYIGDAPAPFTLQGAAGTAFDGLSFWLNGEGSADNQEAPDQSTARDGALTQPILFYEDGHAAGLQAGWCEDFHIVYFGFGLEGVPDPASRETLLGHSFASFNAPPVAAGLRLLPQAIDDYAVPGHTLTYTLRAQNLSETITDTLRFRVESTWPAAVLTPTLNLGPCQWGSTILSVTIPADLAPGATHTLQVLATAAGDGASSQVLTVQHHVPQDILLVDDDRWYDQKPLYQGLLDGMALSYDVWDTSQRGSPSAALLATYDIVLWYTGYDWYQPVTASEMNALDTYLQGGGRLFLSSQSFLYYHHGAALTTDYLGVLDYQESITPTVALAGDGALLGDPAGPFTLEYGPYRNFSDGLIAANHSRVHLWHNQGMAAGVATAGDSWRTLFWGFPLETLPPREQAAAFNHAVGWLSDLGNSAFTVNRRIAPGTLARTYTITLQKLPGAPPGHVAITNALPANLELDLASLSGGATYHAATRQITWQGTLQDSAPRHIIYRAAIPAGVPAGAAITNTVLFHYERHDLQFRRSAVTWVDAPDLTASVFRASAGAVQPGQTFTYTAVLHNQSAVPAAAVTASVRLPDAVQPLTATLHSSSGQASLSAQRIYWQGELAPEASVTVTLAVTPTDERIGHWLSATLLVDDQVSAPFVRAATAFVVPYRFHFPFIATPG